MHPFRLPSGALRAVVLVAVIGGLLAGCAGAATTAPSALTVTDAWARPAAAGAQSAAYLTITNPGGADALLSVRCTVAASAMLHQTATDSSGMTGMSMVDRVPVPAGATVRLEPGGYHVMLTGLGRSLEAGTSVELRLTFEHAGEVVVSAAVRPS